MSAQSTQYPPVKHPVQAMYKRFDALRERIVSLHPYELPEVIAVDIASGHVPYLDWIAAQTEPDASPR
ncbi:MAG: divalent-cation tolerance protein CutA [Proteobacteria bacterium]|nr:divalent-cation tolerance protein CutA [Pseudomonadota bacterium]